MTKQVIIPKHIGIIMDGNGRWAKQKGLPRLEGHRRGTKTTRQVIEWASDLGISHLSLFVFSSENWQRPDAEVQGLMSLLATMLKFELPHMMRNGVCLQTVGNIAAMPEKVQKALQHACDKTKNNTTIRVSLCLNYGGQQEILAGMQQAFRQIMHQEKPQQAIDALSVQDFRQYLWSQAHAPVDMIIRTGNEQRLSNFLLWDAAYAELYFSKKFWPDFQLEDLTEAVDWFCSRQRRFGLTSEQQETFKHE